MTVAQPLIAKFSERQIRLGVLAVLVETLGRWRFVGLACLLALLLFAAAASGRLSPAGSFSAWTGVVVGVSGFLIVAAVLYFVNLRFTMRAFRSLPTKEIRYEFSEEGCAVSSGESKLVLSWSSIVRILRYPSVWLLEINESRPGMEIVQSFRTSLKETRSVAAAQAELPGFPVLWVLPVPLRSFLLMPAADLDEERASFVRRMVKR